MEAVHEAVLTSTQRTIYVLSKYKTNIEHFQLKIDIFALFKIRSILHRRVIVIVHLHSNVYIAFEDVL